jgi:hypothetical protein
MMVDRRIVVVMSVLCVLFAVACMPKQVELTPEIRRAAAGVELLDTAGVQGRLYTILGQVEGLSCARQAGSDPSRDAAREELRVRAAVIGGTAVINIVCQEGQVDWKHNCWRTARYVGDAIVFKDVKKTADKQ